MGDMEAIANAASNFCLTYDLALSYRAHPDAIEANLEILEDAIRAYRSLDHAEGH